MLPAASPQVIFKSLPDGAVLYHPAQEVYYGLNGVGERVWQRLPPVCADLDELCGQLAELYPDVPAATIRADVSELLDDLLQHQLVFAPREAADARRDDAAAS
ncbi:MAG: PqqD family protein [Gemmatimonadota bacterium]|nr:PqqD family protein [Gemmatimonadota bacterium]